MISRLHLWAVVLCVALLSLTFMGPAAELLRTADRESSPAVQAGRAHFIVSGCHLCHGYEGQGAMLTGPRIAPAPLPLPGFIAAIRRPRDEMPAYSPAVLGDDEIRQIHEYLESLPGPAAPTPGLFPGT